MKIDTETWLKTIKKVFNTKTAKTAKKGSKIKPSETLIMNAEDFFNEGKKIIKPKKNKILAGASGGVGLTTGVVGSELLDDDEQVDSTDNAIFANMTPEERKIVNSIMIRAGER